MVKHRAKRNFNYCRLIIGGTLALASLALTVLLALNLPDLPMATGHTAPPPPVALEPKDFTSHQQQQQAAEITQLRHAAEAKAAAEAAAQRAAAEKAAAEAAAAAKAAAEKAAAEKAAQAAAPKPAPTPPPAPSRALTVDAYKAYAAGKVSADQFSCLDQMWTKESGWNPNAQNPSSTAYGIAQFLDSTWATVGFSKSSDPYTQIDAGLAYIAKAYQTPCGAWSFWQAHNYY